MSLRDVDRYFTNYDRVSFSIFACAGSEPGEKDVAAFERTIGFRLPAEFREFTKSSLGGLYVEVVESLWPRPKHYDVGPAWSFLYAIKVFGIAEDIPEWLDIRIQFENLGRDKGGIVPFLQREGEADFFAFVPFGSIVEWDHETGDLRRIDSTFSELLMKEILELEERKDLKVRGERSK